MLTYLFHYLLTKFRGSIVFIYRNQLISYIRNLTRSAEINQSALRALINIWETSEVNKRNSGKSLLKKYLLLLASKKYTASIDLKLFWKSQ